MKKENTFLDKDRCKIDIIADVINPLYSMRVLSFAKIPDGLGITLVQRVPGGWIFYNYNETQATFVPFNNEFQNKKLQ
jgi:hypothetical protein